MKVIVISWMYPKEQEGNTDSRPKSIERICTSIESVKEYMTISHAAFGKYIDWAESLFNLNLKDEGRLGVNDTIDEFYDGDGYKYLNMLLEADKLGTCIARVYYKEENKHEDAHYFLFQVRNLH